MSFTLGIDVGTTGAKAAVVSEDGQVESLAVAALETLSVEGNGVEQDPEAIWSTVRSLVREALAQSGRPRSECAALLCASQYHSVVPVDRQGSPTHNLILWRDQRGAPYNLDIYARHPETLPTWVEVHGLAPSPTGGVSLSHMQWLQHERPKAHDATHAFLEPSDFITCRLTGEIVSNACTAFPLLVTDHRHPDDVHYDARLIELAGIDAAKLPRLVPKDAQVGTLLPEVAQEFGLPTHTPVFAPVNDTQAVAAGTGAVRDGAGGLSVGTTSVLVTPVRDKRSDLAKLLLSMPSPFRGDYLVMAENGLGGKIIEHALERWLAPEGADLDAAYAAFDRTVARVAPGSGGAMFLPWLGGSLAPRPSDAARGAFVNLSLDHDRSHLARAVLEGVALNLRWLTDEVESFTGIELETLTVGGGATAFDSLSQILADVLGRPIHRLETPRAVAARGAGLLAFERLGVLDRGAIAKNVRVGDVFTPDVAARDKYDELFPHFVAAFDAHLELCKGLPTEEPT